MLSFEKTSNKTFSNNIVLIDSLLHQVLAGMVLEFFSGDLSKTSDLLSHIEALNPLGFDTSSQHPFYKYKLKRLYTDIALGMMPSKVWDGHYDATGGYLIVKDDGEIVCYHIYNRNEFESYLIKNTKFETASSSRHEFGSIYQDAGILYINLNLQIRFLK
jgi:type II restriction enzyme